MPFLRNSWYVAAWSQNIGAEPTRITVLGEPIAIYRSQSGNAIALGDICPHRFASLSAGRVVDDVLECPYHGLRFDRSGACVGNPHGEGHIPPGARVRAYPVIERHHALWIWTGDPELSDPSLVPDFSVFDASDIASSRDYLHVGANYELLTDNLLDLSHSAFLHPFLTTEGFAQRSRTEVSQEENKVHSFMWNDNEPLTPVFQALWEGSAKRVDMRSHMHWTVPSNLLLDVGVTEVGVSGEIGTWLPSAHLLTPETETSTHYFWMVGRNCKLADEVIGGVIHEGIKRAFENEDEPMIVQVAANMAGRDFWEMRPAILVGDAAAIRARRMLSKRIRDQENVE
jgi:phenylpropionate dioxygenase-like ring-hydroxylating dioxygenase large terminal subunit